MIRFYEQLGEGAGRAEAARNVQLEMLASSQFRHPYFWASFIQIGAWDDFDLKSSLLDRLP